jgi:hypothetical protein
LYLKNVHPQFDVFLSLILASGIPNDLDQPSRMMQRLASQDKEYVPPAQKGGGAPPLFAWRAYADTEFLQELLSQWAMCDSQPFHILLCEQGTHRRTPDIKSTTFISEDPAPTACACDSF